MNKFSQYIQKAKTVISNRIMNKILVSLGVRQIPISLLRKKMPKSLRVVLEARRKLKAELPKAVYQDIGIKVVVNEEVNFHNEKNVYNEMTVGGIVGAIVSAWFVFVFLMLFGEEKLEKMKQVLYQKLDDINFLGLNDPIDDDEVK